MEKPLRPAGTSTSGQLLDTDDTWNWSMVEPQNPASNHGLLTHAAIGLLLMGAGICAPVSAQLPAAPNEARKATRTETSGPAKQAQEGWSKARINQAEVMDGTVNFGIGAVHSDGSTLVVGPFIYRRDPEALLVEHVLELPPEAGRGRVQRSKPWSQYLVSRVQENLLIVGDPDAKRGTGVVHVFERSGTAWKPVASLEAADAKTYGKFGTSVDLEGNLLAVAAPNQPSLEQDAAAEKRHGAVYLFRRNSEGAWRQVARIADETGPPHQHEVKLGAMVRLSGTRLAVHRQVDNEFGISIGRVEGGKVVWEQELTRSADSIGQLAVFDMEGDILAVRGEPITPGAGGIDEGKVLVFKLGEQGWKLDATLKAPSSDNASHPLPGFGSTITCGSGLILVGSQADSDNRGYAFVGDPTDGWQSVVFKGMDPTGWEHATVLVPTTSGFVAVRQNGKVPFVADVWRDGAGEETPPAVDGLPRVHASKLELGKDGLVHQKGDAEPFTGHAFAVPNGKEPGFEGAYDSGRRAGIHITRYPNGRVATTEQYSQGALHGELREYDPAGRPIRLAVYESGKLKQEKMLVSAEPEEQSSINLNFSGGAGPSSQDIQAKYWQDMRENKERYNKRRIELGMPPIR